ncbi:DUF4238 domain-containing protein [Chitinimonas arctica]|uniref:DUF4238 domain-containing protein n=1 Tax=Chitinimonas arctica TaxID=2594795 RepID=A0A516SJW2_9NEIS|nr:DUF4238 domain-containing protein [Chitinimonas arctica]QDQ28434.1 DUF4238 domain-containing protein [Chitinimonas arctica]
MITPKQAHSSAGEDVHRPLLVGPKRQHFLPQFYLEGFTSDGRLAVYDRKQNKFRLEQPKNTAVETQFYTVRDADDRPRYEVEAMLSAFESKAAPIIGKLVAQKQIDDNERANLAIFVALAAMRTPDFFNSLELFREARILDITKQLYAEVDAVAATLRKNPQFADLSDKDIHEDAKLMVQMAQNDGLEVGVNKNWTVKKAIDTAFNVAPLLKSRDWIVFVRESDKKSFITSDAPVVLISEGASANGFCDVGYGSAKAIILFPLTESCMLVMRGNGGNLNWVPANTDAVRLLNLRVASQCKSYIVGRDEALLRSLVENLALSGKKWQPKMQAQ